MNFTSHLATQQLMGHVSPEQQDTYKEAVRIRREEIQKLQKQLAAYEELIDYPPFKVFIQDLLENREAALNDMARADNPTKQSTACGAFTAIDSILKHTEERINSLTTALKAYGAETLTLP